ncbi:Universal stress protein PHOS32 [Zea mays]|uniref:Universal stress protein PHOS32 n=1 Tax=Zea mays TaxID=4577 RepID=A0A3L6FWE0_MAIZE|nr:Universal stress protein PHOS32 [Zea mays]
MATNPSNGAGADVPAAPAPVRLSVAAQAARSSPLPRASSSPRLPGATRPPRTVASPSPLISPTSTPSQSSGPCRTTSAPGTPSCCSTCAPPPSSTASTGAPSRSPSLTRTTLPRTSPSPREELQKKREENYDAFTSTKAQDLAQPLIHAQIPFKIHVVKDHEMKERPCLEAERLGLPP